MGKNANMSASAGIRHVDRSRNVQLDDISGTKESNLNSVTPNIKDEEQSNITQSEIIQNKEANSNKKLQT